MKTLSLALLTGFAALGITSPAQGAISLYLQPSPQTISVGSLASMDLIVSGLGDDASPSLGGFALDLSYNPAVLSSVSVTFGSHLDLGIGGSLQFSDVTTSGAIHLDELSLQGSADLNTTQPASFKLASLNFRGVGVGLSMIDFTGGSLSDETGTLSLPFTSIAGQIQVNGPALIPEANSTAALLLVGLLGLEWFRRL